MWQFALGIFVGIIGFSVGIVCFVSTTAIIGALDTWAKYMRYKISLKEKI